MAGKRRRHLSARRNVPFILMPNKESYIFRDHIYWSGSFKRVSWRLKEEKVYESLYLIETISIFFCLVKLKLHILIPFNDKIICAVINCLNMIMFWQSCFGVNFRGGTWSAPQLFVFLYSSFSSTSSAASLTRILRLLRLPFFPSFQLPWDKYTNTNTQIQILIQIHKYTNTKI